MNINDDDLYLVQDETGEILHIIGSGNRFFYGRRPGDKEMGGTWMIGLVARWRIRSIQEAARSGTSIKLSGGAQCSVGANMGTRRVWVHGTCGTLVMTRDEAAAFIHALEHSIEQIDIAEFRESSKERTAA